MLLPQLNLIMLLLLLFVLSGVFCDISTYDSGCSSEWQVSCDNGECISLLFWCDSVEHCSDGSDERKGCAPLLHEAAADSPMDAIGAPSGRLLPKVGRETTEAVAKAAKYIISQVTEDGWGDFTPRAAVALSFADKVSSLNPDEKTLMMKHLEIHLSRELLKMTVRGIKPSLTSLASYINALYATCQDPRSYQGHDLVALLRSEVDVVLSPNFSYPYVLMSLCLADSIKGNDVYRLADMYNNNSKIGFRALAITAMSCIGNKDKDIRRRIQKFVKDFFKDINEAVDKMDIYSKTLYLQAAIASNFSTPGDIARYHLESYQLSDGSFGDILATYSSIPVLLYNSLLDLRCTLPARKALIGRKELKRLPEHEVLYSLWIPSEQKFDTHSMLVPFGENATFLDVMRTAAARNSLYQFLYEETPAGKKVFSLAGIPNDIETAQKWSLYAGHANVTIDDHKNLKELTVGIDKISPKKKKHLIFCFTR